MISASKSNLSLNNLKIFRPIVTKNLKNLRKKFCKSPPWNILFPYDNLSFVADNNANAGLAHIMANFCLALKVLHSKLEV